MNQWTYIILLFTVLLIFFLSLYLYIRRAYAIRKVCSMTVQDKLSRINQITVPFGFEYRISQDIFTSRIDAWQKDCGYCSLYDSHAPFFHMIFDCEPVYFDYDGVTWLIEFWKGQYGITTGCEIGIYKADRLISKKERSKTLFQSVSEEYMPVFSVTLLKDSLPVSRMTEKHWWLTSFCVGQYASPELLTMKIAVIFSTGEMCRSFLSGLKEAGYPSSEIYVNDNAVAFTFGEPHAVQPFLLRTWYRRWILFKNKILLRLYLTSSKPFHFTIDRLLLLYEYLPLLFRHFLKLRRTGKNRRQKA